MPTQNDTKYPDKFLATAEATGGATTPRDLLVALHTDPRTGRAPACRLGCERATWEGWLAAPPTAASVSEVARELAVPVPALRRMVDLIPQATRLASEERRRAEAAGGRLVTRLDDDYPAPLLDLALPPPVLVVAGEIPEMIREAGLAVSMVGSRRSDAYGLEVAAHLARGLAGTGLPVVSGFARGVDTASHRAALDGGGETVAVLGCGLDIDYPRGNQTLGRRIVGVGAEAPSGAVISEFPCGAGPRAWHFPVRNRIIAALSIGTVVVRAAQRSGSLITARLALDLGREVLAVPGPVFDRLSQGPHHLLRDGATPACSPQDVVDALLGPSGAWNLLERGLRLGAGGFEERAQGDAGSGDRTEVREGTEVNTGTEVKTGTGPGKDRGRPRAEPAGKERRHGTGSGAPEIDAPTRGLPAKLLAAMPVGRERSPEALAADLSQNIDAVLAALLELELGGWVRRMPGPAYARRATGSLRQR